MARQKTRRSPREHIIHKTSRYLLANAVYRSKQRRLPCTITRAWIEERLRGGVCEVTAIPFQLGSNRPSPFSASIDRIDQRLGYTSENSRVVAYGYSVIRLNGSDDEARRWIRKVVAIQSAGQPHSPRALTSSHRQGLGTASNPCAALRGPSRRSP